MNGLRHHESVLNLCLARSLPWVPSALEWGMVVLPPWSRQFAPNESSLQANRYSVSRRVSLVNYRGTAVLDVYVQPTMEVTDYRTSTTGIEAKHLLPGEAECLNLSGH